MCRKVGCRRREVQIHFFGKESLDVRQKVLHPLHDRLRQVARRRFVFGNRVGRQFVQIDGFVRAVGGGNSRPRLVEPGLVAAFARRLLDEPQAVHQFFELWRIVEGQRPQCLVPEFMLDRRPRHTGGKVFGNQMYGLAVKEAFRLEITADIGGGHGAQARRLLSSVLRPLSSDQHIRRAFMDYQQSGLFQTGDGLLAQRLHQFRAHSRCCGKRRFPPVQRGKTLGKADVVVPLCYTGIRR
ncbi:MAG: hypothetical protein LBJ59_09620 [Zoogloeaceae bacterium]|nr:hypothetical protein [Zoogloeaceae bacterium]